MALPDKVNEDAQNIRARFEAGMGITQIANDLDISRRAVYGRAARAGMDVLGRKGLDLGTVRCRVADMKPREAVDYLLYVLEALLGTDEHIADLCAAGLSPQRARIFAALSRASPRVVGRSALEVAADSNSDELASTVMNVQIHHIRRHVERHGWPVRVESIRGIGYRLVSIEGSEEVALRAPEIPVLLSWR